MRTVRKRWLSTRSARGRDLVIQGPPGTGKSQTIANIIAAAVADGKTVLFMAEKMAALEVVKRRLDQANLGDACLELHSSKANKRALLAELQHVWELGAPKGEAAEAHDRRLLETRDSLNAHPDRMHQIYRPYNLTPYQVIGHLTRLRRMGLQPSDIELPAAVGWSPDAKDRIVTILSELAQRIDDIGLPSKHAWHGVGLTGITPLDLERKTTRLANASGDKKQSFELYEGRDRRPPLGARGFDRVIRRSSDPCRASRDMPARDIV